MMTTMAAMLGGVPLMLGTGTGSEIRQPLGYAMVGGLIVSQALTLFTTPVCTCTWTSSAPCSRSGLSPRLFTGAMTGRDAKSTRQNTQNATGT